MADKKRFHLVETDMPPRSRKGTIPNIEFTELTQDFLNSGMDSALIEDGKADSKPSMLISGLRTAIKNLNAGDRVQIATRRDPVNQEVQHVFLVNKEKVVQ